MTSVPGEITVLVVDDDPVFQEVIVHYLAEDSRYKVITADSGQEALKIVATHSLSAIIADYQMPEMDGLDLLRILRDDNNSIPFIIFTGQGCESVAIQALNEGADFYLVKGEDPGPQFLVLRKNLGEIVAKRQADEALRISEARNRKMLSLLKATLDATEDGILVETTDGTITGCNERFLQVFQLDRTQVQERTWADIASCIAPFLTDDHHGDVSTPVLSEDDRRLGYLTFNDGRVLEVHVRPQICAGNPVGKVWSYHDLTARIRAEQALRESRERFRILFDNSPISHQALSSEGAILEVNQTWLTMLGYLRDEVIGKSFEFFCHPESPSTLPYCLSDLLQNSYVRDKSFTLTHKNGSQVFVIVDGLVVRGRDGSILQIQCALRDITRQRETEKQLAWTESLLHEVVDLLPFGICVTQDDDHRILFHNSRFYEIWGVKATDKTQAYLSDLMNGSSVVQNTFSDAGSDHICLQPEIICFELELPGKRFFRQYKRKLSIDPEDTRILWAFEDITLFKKQEEEIRQYARILEIVSKMISLANRAKEVRDLCQMMIASVVPLMNFEIGAVYLIGEDTNSASQVAGYNIHGAGVSSGVMVSLTGYPHLLLDKQPLFSENPGLDMAGLIPDGAFTAGAVIPLTSGDHITGIMTLLSQRRTVPVEEEKTLLVGIGREIGGAITRLHDQKALHSARQNLENLVNSINDMVFVIDMASGVILEVNEEVLRRLQHDRNILIGKPALSSPDHVSSLFPFRDHLDESSVLEHTLQSRTGTVIDVETRITHGLWNGRKVFFYVSRDITDSKIVQQRVRRSEERLRALFESSPIGIILYDITGGIIETNQAVREIFGCADQDSLLQYSLLSDPARPDLSFHGHDGPVMYERIIPLHRTEGYTGSSVHEERIEARVIVTPLKREGGQNEGYLVLIEDITRERESVRLLCESEAFNRGLVTNLPDYIMVYNKEGKVLYVNPSGIIGMRGDDHNFIGESIFTYIIPEHRRVVEHRVKERLAGKDVPPYEIRVSRLDGSILDVMVQATMIPYQGEDAVLVVLTDITSRKEGEEELEKYTQILQMTVDALATANKKLNLLSDVTRHDILNQVHIIFGYLDLIHEEPVSDEQQAIFQRIDEAVTVINQQIQFTRSYQELGVNRPEWQNLTRAIAPLAHPGITITTDLSGYSILADPLLPKVFENLLDNSVRHGARVTQIEISVCPTDDGRISIIWRDNGKGVADADKEKIFEKGYGKNTGFGLFLIREILALTGITIKEVGVQDEGACFILGVPKGAFRSTS